MTTAPELRNQIKAWIEQEPLSEYVSELNVLLDRLENDESAGIEIANSLFGGRVKFGTAGVRGPMKPGPLGINRIVVSQTTTGLCQWLLTRVSAQKGQKPVVVVGFDGRNFSRRFGQDVSEVLSGHNISVFTFSKPVPSPVLAFSVRLLAADAGVMVTASHNPATDNGLKIFLGGSDEGSQLTAPVDSEIESRIEEVAHSLAWSDIPRSTDEVTVLDDLVVEKYIVATLDSLQLSSPTTRSPVVVYTAMHGVGGDTFLAAMATAGFPEPYVVEQQFYPDPDFPTVEFPNPEEQGALDLGFKRARSVGADLIIAHDPDADRLAVALPDTSASAGYRALTGNQIGAIFGWQMAQKALSTGQVGTLANSLVSSPVLGKIAEHFNLHHEETLTGFKYVSRVKNLIFGFEEALGYLVTPDVVRDKDGISAGLLMVSLAHTLAGEGKTLWDYLHEIEESVGAFASGQVTIRLSPGVAGSTVTTSLRERKLSALGSRSVARFDDFLEGVGKFPKEDILRYYLDDGTRVIARPSGTEPKVKVYIDTEGTNSADAQSRLTEVESDVNELVSSL